MDRWKDGWWISGHIRIYDRYLCGIFILDCCRFKEVERHLMNGWMMDRLMGGGESNLSVALPTVSDVNILLLSTFFFYSYRLFIKSYNSLSFCNYVYFPSVASVKVFFSFFSSSSSSSQSSISILFSLRLFLLSLFLVLPPSPIPLFSPLSLPEPHSPVFMFPLFHPVLHFCPHLLLALRPPFHLVLQYSHFPSPALHPSPALFPPSHLNPLHWHSSSFYLRSCAPTSAWKMPSSISRPFTPTPPRCRHAQAHFAEACVFILHTDANLRLKLPRGERSLTLIQSSCQLLKAQAPPSANTLPHNIPSAGFLNCNHFPIDHRQDLILLHLYFFTNLTCVMHDGFHRLGGVQKGPHLVRNSASWQNWCRLTHRSSYSRRAVQDKIPSFLQQTLSFFLFVFATDALTCIV